MAKASANDVDEQVRPLLLALATADGELKLLGAGDPAPLLDKKTGPGKVVYDRLTGGDDPLATARKAGKAEFARLTAAGFLHALPHMPGGQVAEAVRRFAGGLRAAERLDFLQKASRAAGDESAAVLAVMVEAVQAEAATQSEAAARRRRAEAAIVEQLLALKRDDVRRLRDELDAAEALVGRLGGLADSPRIPPREPEHKAATPTSGQPLTPTDPDDLPFRRQVLKRLATAWAEAFDNKRAEALRYLEAAIHNLQGVRPVGEPDEELPFDGTLHHARRAVNDEQPVRVVRPGWVLDEDHGRHVILPAEVE